QLRQLLGFDLLDGDQEVSFLTSDILAVVVLWEGQRESLGVASLHAANSLFESFEHLTFANQELEAFSLATFKWHAVDLAFEVDRHAIAVSSAFSGWTLCECATLLAQDFNGAVDRSVVDFSGGT